ncbi:Uncharacterised protein [Paenibacillus thiaminolyticus]|nr:Uncharacterised protein [Paenibacillus thiaminolyticus]
MVITEAARWVYGRPSAMVHSPRLLWTLLGLVTYSMSISA